MIGRQVDDLVAASRIAIERIQPQDIDAVRGAAEPCIQFSSEMREMNLELKRFLRSNLYRHEQVRVMTDNARHTVTALFEAFFADPALMPPDSAARAERAETTRGDAGRARMVADYIAGMTDRYASSELARIS